jgi:hypothetical protein
MPWGEEQERLTQVARLNAASPEEVFRELKRTAPKSRIELLGRDKALEAGLVERNDPLINLGLACYGTNEEVFTALYKHGLAKPADAADERYKLGLRIGCLSNRSVVAAHWVSDFPRQLIGPEEIHRVLAAGEDGEAEALILQSFGLRQTAGGAIWAHWCLRYSSRGALAQFDLSLKEE